MSNTELYHEPGLGPVPLVLDWLRAADDGFAKDRDLERTLVERRTTLNGERKELLLKLHGPPVPTVRESVLADHVDGNVAYVGPLPAGMMRPKDPSAPTAATAGTLALASRAAAKAHDVEAVLAGKLLPDVDVQEQTSKRIGEINRELEAVEEAIRIVRSRLSIARQRASKVVCGQRRAEHSDLAGQVALSLLAAHQAATALKRFTDNMEAHGIAWKASLPVIDSPSVLGRLNDKSSDLASLLREAVKAGLIAERDLPTELQR